jgi:hypothetical protein
VVVDRINFAHVALISVFALLGMPAYTQLLPEEMQNEEEVVEEVRFYSVEVIVFEYASNVSAGNEIFEPIQGMDSENSESSVTGIPTFGDMSAKSATAGDEDEVIEFGDFVEAVEEEVNELELIPSMSDIEFRLLTEEELSTADIHERLLTLDAYQPVLWGGWVQSVHERAATPSIRLRALGIPPIHIDGTFTLYLKNYLHLAVDLTREQKIATVQPIYRQEKPSRGTTRSYDDNIQSYDDDAYGLTDTQTIIYQIKEDRLFNSGQLRYYDHPKFGVLARVTRVEVSTPEDGTEDEDDPQGRSMLSSTE